MMESIADTQAYYRLVFSEMHLSSNKLAFNLNNEFYLDTFGCDSQWEGKGGGTSTKECCAMAVFLFALGIFFPSDLGNRQHCLAVFFLRIMSRLASSTHRRKMLVELFQQ